jgi:adenylosuccinate synthase
MKADIVIGAGYGDEGKGLMTDHLVEHAYVPTVVVRFNGGAQAGHTVMRDGMRHVFGHFGAGSLQGATTYLSKFFVINPLLFVKEHSELITKGVMPKVIIDGGCIVTTPYDMLMNQLLETMRGANRHGSCGVGFGETIDRAEKAPSTTLYARDLQNISKVQEQAILAKAAVINKLQPILNELMLNKHCRPLVDLIYDGDLLDGFIDNVKQVSAYAVVASNWLASNDAAEMHWVFEGAQGLKLDMDAGAFPYVTRSNTGLQNVAHLLQGIDREVNVHYMTRAYRTRHGAGPLQHEGKPLPKVSDLTNFKNEFQGSLRFAPLDIDELLSDIMRDVSLHSNGLQAKHHVCVTCMDQLNNGSVDVVLNGKVETMQHSRMLAELNRLPSLNLLAVSNGPAAKDIEYV